VKRLRETYLSPALFHYYKNPVMIVEGKMQYLWDDKGRRYDQNFVVVKLIFIRYLDAIGGIVTVSVGHCHPKV